MKTILQILFAGLLIFPGCHQNPSSEPGFPALTGPYLGQPLPDTVPELFAPGIIGTGMFTRDIAMPPTLDELYYCVGIGNYNYSTILFTKLENGHWTRPEAVPFATSAKIFDFEPAFSPDGQRLYFLSSRPDGDEEPGDQDIWYVDRTEDGWGTPVNPGAPLNSDGGEFFPSVTRDSFLYFTHNDKGNMLNEIFRSRIYPDSIGTPELLPDQVNCGTNRFNAFVSPDHTYAIIPAMGVEGAFDQVDYFISFRNENDRWSEPINLGASVNKDNTRGWSPYVSPDGNYFFFMANWSDDVPADSLSYDKMLELHNSPRNGNSDIYWMKADFIQELRNKALFE